MRSSSTKRRRSTTPADIESQSDDGSTDYDSPCSDQRRPRNGYDLRRGPRPGGLSLFPGQIPQASRTLPCRKKPLFGVGETGSETASFKSCRDSMESLSEHFASLSVDNSFLNHSSASCPAFVASTPMRNVSHPENVDIFNSIDACTSTPINALANNSLDCTSPPITHWPVRSRQAHGFGLRPLPRVDYREEDTDASEVGSVTIHASDEGEILNARGKISKD